jgi:hypothetical protein
MSRRLLTAMLGGLGGLLLAACGGSERLDESDLPDRLADALPRLERAGYEVDAVPVGADDIPALIVKVGDVGVVLAAAPGIGRPSDFSVPTRVRDASGNPFDANMQTICGPDAYIAGPRGTRGVVPRVIRVSRLC